MITNIIIVIMFMRISLSGVSVWLSGREQWT